MTTRRQNVVTALVGIGFGVSAAAVAAMLFPGAVGRWQGWIVDGFLAALSGFFTCF